ncbi:MAG: hypothetical protein R3E79_28645 [Caldilineaceae bacterium]
MQTTSPAQLDLVGYMLGRVWKVVANETIAVALTSGDLVLLDIRTPTQPRIISRLLLRTVSQEARFDQADLTMSGNYVFVSCPHCSEIGLIVVNIAVPTMPAVVGQMKTPAYVDVVKVYRDLLYIALGGEQFGIVDISTPTAPKLLGSQRLSGQFASIRDIEIIERAGARFAFVVAQNGKLSIFDVTTPVAPAEVATYAPAQACMQDAAVVESGGQLRLYAVDCYVGIRVLDVTSPTQPHEIQVYSLGQDNQAYTITAVDHLLFVTTDVESTSAWDSTLHVLDISSALIEVGTFHDFLYAYDLDVFDQMLIIADHQQGIQLLDFTDPTTLHEVGRQVTVSAYSDLESDGRYLYWVDPTGFKVVDVVNPVLPVYLAEVATPYAVNLEVNGGFALVTDYQGGLWIFDVQQPMTPSVVSHTSTPILLSTDIVISGTLGAHATAFVGGVGCHPFGCQPSLVAVDLTDLQQPTASVMLSNEDGVADMVQLGDFLYLTTGSPALLSISDLLVLDIANPQLPIEVAQVALPSSAASVAVAGQALYIALTNALQTYDISNPAVPLLKHTLPLPHTFHSISVEQGFLYGKDNFNLTLISLLEPFQPTLIERQALPAQGVGIVAANGLLAADGFVYVLNDGLTTWRHQTDLLGWVFDAWGEPQPGVMIDILPEAAITASEAAPFTFSGLTGSYAFPAGMTGVYTLQPTFAGYSVWPPVRHGVSHKLQDAQDFYLLAQPVSTTITAGAAATLSYVDGRGLPTSVMVPAGAVAASSTVHLISIVAFDQGDLHFTGNAFELRLFDTATQVEKSAFDQPVMLTIHYSDQGANAILDENRYQLMMEVDGSWQALLDGEQIVRNREENSFVIPVRATGRYALFGKGYNAYLPLVVQ